MRDVASVGAVEEQKNMKLCNEFAEGFPSVRFFIGNYSQKYDGVAKAEAIIKEFEKLSTQKTYRLSKFHWILASLVGLRVLLYIANFALRWFPYGVQQPIIEFFSSKPP